MDGSEVEDLIERTVEKEHIPPFRLPTQPWMEVRARRVVRRATVV